MAFQSDGKRTWDADRQYELLCLGGGYEGEYRFQIISPQGKLYFNAEWNPYKVENKDRVNDPDNPNADVITEWIVNINAFFPGLSDEDTKRLIGEAMKSYVWAHGGNRLRGYPCRDVTCRFTGKYGDVWVGRSKPANDASGLLQRLWQAFKKKAPTEVGMVRP